MFRLVLIRHGESTWNQENLFTGWTDIDLTERGIREAHAAGVSLKASGYKFDISYTSVLKRAIRTLWIVLDEMDMMWIPVINDWRLNERHYGALQGLNKAETAAKYGEAQVKIWRRSYDVPPPQLTIDDPRYCGNDPRYQSLRPEQVPLSESLLNTYNRVMPFWNEIVVPEVKSGKQLLIVAHGNSIRAIVKYLDGISDADIAELNIPTGIPLIYEFDQEMRVTNHFYLADEKDLAQAQQAVANQGKVRK